EDESARLRREIVERRGETEILQRLDVGGDEAERSGEALALVVRVDAEASLAAEPVGEVELAVDLQLLLHLCRGDAVEELAHVVSLQLAELVQQLDVPLPAHGPPRTC